MSPQISVVLPIRDAQDYLPQAIDSILNQTFADFELIAIDDGSRDASPAILRSYSDRDPRVRVETRPHRGLVATLNEGLALARGPLVARMDADDIALPERFEVQYRQFERDPSLWVLGTAEELIDSEGKSRGRPAVVTGSEAVAKALCDKCVISHPSVMMRRETIITLGGYRPAYKHAEDYDLWLRVSEKGKIDNLDYVGVQHRTHADSVTERHAPHQLVSTALAQATHKRRVVGLDDPTTSLAAEPSLWSEPLFDELVPAHVQFFRIIDLAFRAGTPEFDAELALNLLKSQEPSLIRTHRKRWQEALVYMFRARLKFDRLDRSAMYQSARVHPGRFLRYALKIQGNST